MKKLLSLFVLSLWALTLSGCESKPVLHVINWGDYMDPDLIKAFETEYGVEVSYRIVGSNEEMATLLLSQQSPYDVVVPSEYMVDKLINEGYLQPIDFTKLTNYSTLTVTPRLKDLYSGSGIDPYVVPYTWGTIGILYDATNVELKTLIETKGWAAMFEYTAEYDVGMYDSPRDAVGAALLYKGYNVNSEVPSELDEAEQALVDGDFSWGEDNLRSLVISGVLDMALVYSGDYFMEYYFAQEDGHGAENNFGFFVPPTTNVWMDSMALCTSSENTDLAHQFIDFFLRFDVAVANADYIGYAPCFDEVYTELVDSYGYDLPNFDPFPEGSSRQMYEYGTDARSQRLTEIRNTAKISD